MCYDDDDVDDDDDDDDDDGCFCIAGRVRGWRAKAGSSAHSVFLIFVRRLERRFIEVLYAHVVVYDTYTVGERREAFESERVKVFNCGWCE